jgi:3-hydroxybutyryl-CoA dehydratase
MKNEMIKEPRIVDYEKIHVGDIYSFNHMISEDDINAYANLIGDFNPMHIDDDYAKNTMYEGKISHGMLAASLFSTLLGMYCPGRDSIILAIDVKFKKPIRPNISLKISGEVISKVDAIKMLTFKLNLSDEENTLIVGEAKAKKI